MEPLELYKRLLEEFGPRKWWPAETPFEVCVGAILTQNTNWKNVEKAIVNLREANALKPEKIAGMNEGRLRRLVKPSGYYRQKAKRLKLFCLHLKKYGFSLEKLFGKPLPELRSELLSLHGIGPETADSIMLYAAGRPSFVIDAYTFRLNDKYKLKKLGSKTHEKKYAELKLFFESSLPRSVPLYKEFHALIVEWGKRSSK